MPYKKIKKPVLLITGPTASGKTNLAEDIGHHLPIEIINSDSGQFYTRLSVGTAKPDWQKSSLSHHLFDIVDKPVKLNVALYRNYAIKTIKEVQKRGNIPVVVGGSLFYIQSLFFPVVSYPDNHQTQLVNRHIPHEKLWEMLNSIDPLRASDLHPNDHYRIQRALNIWQKTGKRPSSFKPVWSFDWPLFCITLEPRRDILFSRITQRCSQMLQANDGWIQEVEEIKETKWESFVRKKKFIGYTALLNWIAQGKASSLDSVQEEISAETLQYAKRQMTFLKKMKKTLAHTYHNKQKTLVTSYQSSQSILGALLKKYHDFFVCLNRENGTT